MSVSVPLRAPDVAFVRATTWPTHASRSARHSGGAGTQQFGRRGMFLGRAPACPCRQESTPHASEAEGLRGQGQSPPASWRRGRHLGRAIGKGMGRPACGAKARQTALLAAALGARHVRFECRWSGAQQDGKGATCSNRPCCIFPVTAGCCERVSPCTGRPKRLGHTRGRKCAVAKRTGGHIFKALGRRRGALLSQADRAQ